MNRAELVANVDTIVVVMMENRSFDHMLGHLRLPAYGNRAEVDGIESLTNKAYLNPNGDGIGVPPFLTPDGPLPSDMPHDPAAVRKQLAYATLSQSYLMNGFVQAFEDEFQSSMANPPVMGLQLPSSVPTTGALADSHTICDRWFACLPTSTAPNRLMSWCGYTDHSDTGTLLPDQGCVYDWLARHNVRWRVYAAGLPFFLLMPRLVPTIIGRNFRRLADLANDIASEDASTWPQVIFIEPDYHDCPVHLHAPCDNHAPLPVGPGEAFLAQVYGWLTSQPARWGRMVLFVTYDEHGGFFDHVPPLRVAYRNPNGVAFDTTGPRVPVIVASPFAGRTVCHAPLDNTSILQLLAERFGAPGEAYSAEVANRMNQGIASASVTLVGGAGNAPLAPVAAGAPAAVAAPTPAQPTSYYRAFDAALRSLEGNAAALAKYAELAGYRKP